MEGENFPYPPFSLVRYAYGRPKYGRRKRLVKFFFWVGGGWLCTGMLVKALTQRCTCLVQSTSIQNSIGVKSVTQGTFSYHPWPHRPPILPIILSTSDTAAGRRRLPVLFCLGRTARGGE